MEHDRPALGLCFSLLSGLMFGCTPTFSRQLQLGGMDPFSICFFSQAACCLVLGGFSAASHRPLRVGRRELLRLALCGAVGMGCTTLLLNLAYQRIPVGVATCLHFCYPSVVVVLTALLHRAPPGRRKGLAVLCSLAGMLFLAGGAGAGGHMGGFLFALASSVTFAFYLLGNGALAGRLPVSTRLFYINLFAALFNLPLCLLQGGPRLVGPLAWLPLSILTGLLGHLLLGRGVELCGPERSAFGSMTEPVTSALLGALVLQEGLGLKKLLGLFCIVLSIALTARQGRGQASTCRGGEHP